MASVLLVMGGEPDRQTDRPCSIREGTMYTESGKHVLLIEEDPELAARLAEHLSRDGMIVTIVFDGEGAIAEAATQRHDLITLNGHMEANTGLPLHQELRSSVDQARAVFIRGGGHTDKAAGG